MAVEKGSGAAMRVLKNQDLLRENERMVGVQVLGNSISHSGMPGG
jgi:hypothetical protein